MSDRGSGFVTVTVDHATRQTRWVFDNLSGGDLLAIGNLLIKAGAEQTAREAVQSVVASKASQGSRTGQTPAAVEPGTGRDGNGEATDASPDGKS